MNTGWVLVIPGVPVAKGRPRFSRAGAYIRTYTPEKTVRFEDSIRLYAQVAGVRPIDAPIRLEVRAVWPMSGSPRKRVPRPGAWKTTSPDLDNVCKAVMDALNGVAYPDDGRVVELIATKEHAPQGGAPRTEITITPLDGARFAEKPTPESEVRDGAE